MNKKQYLHMIDFLRNKETEINRDLDILRLVYEIKTMEEE